MTDDHPTPALRAWLMKRVVAGVPTVVAFQRLCGVKDGKATNKFLDILFKAGAASGNEAFFITFLPSLFWCFDLTVGRLTVLVWMIAFTLGQAAKDFMMLPRPFSIGPVAQLESHYSWEGGWPSTHAMNALSMPVYLTWLSWDRVNPTVRVGLLVMTTLWYVLCVGSRLYLGVHTPVDIVWGTGIGVCMLIFGTTLAFKVDEWVLDNPWSPLIMIVVIIILIQLYPKPKSPKWVNSPGDTMLIMSTGVAVLTGAHFTAAAHYTSSRLPIVDHPFTSPHAFLSAIGRILFGFMLVGGTRAVLKVIGMKIMVALRGEVFAPDDDLSVVVGLSSPTASSGAALAKSVSTPAFAVSSSVAAGTASEGLRKRGGKGEAEQGSAAGGSGFLAKPSLLVPEPSASSAAGADTLGLPLTPLGTPREAPAGGASFKAAPPPSIDTSSPAAVDPLAASLKNDAERKALAAARAGAPPGMVRVAPGRRYDIELPVKFLTYWGVGIVTVYVVPNLFHAMGWRVYPGMSW